MGNQINTQPQTFKTNTVVMGSAAGLSAVSGLTVYGDISASGTIYGVGAVPISTSHTFNGSVASFAVSGYTGTTATNYLAYLDGVHQIPVTDYTVASNGTITFTPTPVSGVVANVIAFQSSIVATNELVASKIDKPSSASAGQILTYNGSTSTWVASANTAAKVWLNFNGTKDTAGIASTSNTNRLIRSSYNVASVLRNGAGDYTITFSTPMTDANYSISLTSGGITGISDPTAWIRDGSVELSTSALRIVTGSSTVGTLYDAVTVHVQIFGN